MVVVKRYQFKVVTGADVIQTLEPQDPYTCRRSFCGTALGEPMSPDDSFPINAQCLDDDPGIRHTFHEHLAAAPPWIERPTNAASADRQS